MIYPRSESNQRYDLIVVGCGLTGGIIAYLAAKRLRKRVLILEKRNHIGGNMFDEKDSETGILIQKYGPHSFHTDREAIYKLVREIGEWEPFVLRARVCIKNRLTMSPFNFQTVETYFSPQKAFEIKSHLVNYFSYRPKVTILEMMESTDETVMEYAQFLFNEDYKPYTAKQWGIPPERLDISVLQRVPVRLSYIDQYFDDRFQMQPKGGYTAFFKKMLDVPGIDIHLSSDACSRLTLQENRQISLDHIPIDIPVVYTGALDELFCCKYGSLPYRSLFFQYQRRDTPNFQPVPGVAYPLADGYTRITEFSKLMPLPPQSKETIIAYEYPEKYGAPNGHEPYYPVLTEESQALYRAYLEESRHYPQLYPCGRLGDFKYYNMDQAILRAIQVFETLPL